LTKTLCVFTALVVTAGSLLALPARTADLAAQSDLDAFMAKVLASRDENWKKLQQYILDESQRIDVLGPGGMRLWGERRDSTWYVRDGFFVKSPLKVNGVTVPEDDRRKAEDEFLSRLKRRDERDREREREKTAKPADPAGAASGTTPATPAPTERAAQEMPSDLQGLLVQTRQPEFVDSAYFLRFKFEQGKYAFVGRETLDGREVLRIEYYPTRLFSDDEEEAARRKRAKKPAGEAEVEATMQRLMNKVSMVTIWVEPTAHQIVKYTFDNANFDFLPAAWLVRVNDVKATMTMSQPFKDVWLPRDVDMRFGAMLAIGAIEMRYRLDYSDYRQATTSGRIKKLEPR
jgi:hypothetical protein